MQLVRDISPEGAQCMRFFATLDEEHLDQSWQSICSVRVLQVSDSFMFAQRSAKTRAVAKAS
jgi:hypothetical protein